MTNYKQNGKYRSKISQKTQQPVGRNGKGYILWMKYLVLIERDKAAV